MTPLYVFDLPRMAGIYDRFLQRLVEKTAAHAKKENARLLVHRDWLSVVGEEAEPLEFIGPDEEEAVGVPLIFVHDKSTVPTPSWNTQDITALGIPKANNAQGLRACVNQLASENRPPEISETIMPWTGESPTKNVAKICVAHLRTPRQIEISGG